MALFGRKQTDPADVPAEVAKRARMALAGLGLESTIEPGATAEDVELLGADNWRYPLYNLIVSCRSEPQKSWDGLIAQHLGRLVRTRSEQPVDQLDATSLRAQIRTRVMPAQRSLGPIDVDYARPLAEGLMLILCVDFPESVSTIGSHTLPNLPLTVEELFDIGQANTNAEPVDEHSDLGRGVRLLSGESMFTASKIADLRALSRLTGPIPHGLIFAVVERGSILYTVPNDVGVVDSISAIAEIVHGVASDPSGEPAGGIISTGLYYAVDEEIQLFGVVSDGGELQVSTTGRFGDMLNDLR